MKLPSISQLSGYIKTNIEYIIFFTLLIILFILIAYKTIDKFTTQPRGINQLDAIIYINLENRTDRKEFIIQELESLGVDMKKVHKVSGVYIPKNGHKGCVQSHIIALKMIKMNNWRRVLILEDDAQLTIPPELFNAVLDSSLPVLDNKYPNWNILMLATANKRLKKDKHNNTNQEALKIYGADGTQHPLSIVLEQIESATTSSAYIINENTEISYVEKILGLFETCNNKMKHDQLNGDNYENWALDQKWSNLQQQDNWFAFNKDIMTQREIWSSIMTESHY